MTHLAQDELGLAAARGDLAALRTARAGGANVLGSGDPDALTTLHWACGGGNADVALWLLRVCGADVHASRRNHFFPIHTAAMQGHAPVVRLLLAAGADPDVQTQPEGRRPRRPRPGRGSRRWCTCSRGPSGRRRGPASRRSRGGRSSSIRALRSGT